MHVEHANVLLTGAGSGIGAALAQALAPNGVRLTLVGRREQPLLEVARRVEAAGGQAQVVTADVAESGATDRVVAAAVERFGELNMVINNAGNVRAGRLDRVTEDEVRAQVEVNVTAPILLTRAALPSLRASGGGLVVNISSAIALVGLPFYATYAGSKAALAQFGEALRRELHGEGVSVLTVYPGATSTPMMDSSHAGPEHGFDYEPPETVAAAIVAAIERDQHNLVRGGEERTEMIQTNRDDPEHLDAQLAAGKDALERAVADHASL